MKSVMLPIQPKYCQLIASGSKTNEIRKTRPKIKPPFKCYIYCTKPKKWFLISRGMRMAKDFLYRGESREVRFGDALEMAGNGIDFELMNGKVIGEFVCDEVRSYTAENLIVKEDAEKVLSGSCLSRKEVLDYTRKRNGRTAITDYSDFYAWHISKLKIYDKPKGINEFTGVKRTTNSIELYQMERAPQSWCNVADMGDCK